jgi:hypothetical protein
LVALEHKSSVFPAEACEFGFPGRGEVVVAVMHLAAGWRVEAAQDIEKRRLAAPE